MLEEEEDAKSVELNHQYIYIWVRPLILKYLDNIFVALQFFLLVVGSQKNSYKYFCCFIQIFFTYKYICCSWERGGAGAGLAGRAPGGQQQPGQGQAEQETGQGGDRDDNRANGDYHP